MTVFGMNDHSYDTIPKTLLRFIDYQLYVNPNNSFSAIKRDDEKSVPNIPLEWIKKCLLNQISDALHKLKSHIY